MLSEGRKTCKNQDISVISIIHPYFENKSRNKSASVRRDDFLQDTRFKDILLSGQ